jgi:hypothetical protein
VGYAALFEPADRAVELNLGIDQLCRLITSPRRNDSKASRTSSTFSGDTARSVSRGSSLLAHHSLPLSRESRSLVSNEVAQFQNDLNVAIAG